MSRNKGLASFSANFEPQIAAPLDARNLVQTLADLTSATVWEANDGGNYTYVGMSVVVSSDPTPANNGLYILISPDYTLAASWLNVGTSGVTTIDWVATTNYTINTVVSHNGFLWVATAISLNEEPVDGDEAHWRKLSAREQAITSMTSNVVTNIYGQLVVYVYMTPVDNKIIVTDESLDKYESGALLVIYNQSAAPFDIEAAGNIGFTLLDDSQPVSFPIQVQERKLFFMQGGQLVELTNSLVGADLPPAPYLNLNNLVKNGYFFIDTDGWVLDAVENTPAVIVPNATTKSGNSAQFYGNPVGQGCKYTYDFETDAPFLRVSFRGRAQTFFFGAFVVDIRSNDVDQDLLMDIGALLTTTEDSYDVIVPTVAGKTSYRININATGGMDNAQVELSDILIQPELSSGSEIFNDLTPTEIVVGGIAIGSTFVNQTMKQMWDRLLYPEIFPVLTPPSSTFTLTQAGLQEVGAILPTLNFSSAFNRGSIVPAYTTSGFRAGLPNNYGYTGTGLVDVPSVLLTDAPVVNNYTVLLGAQTWSGDVDYDAGEQPLSNKGNNYLAPLIAGTTAVITRTINGVYPFFGTTVAMLTQTKQPLVLHNATYFQLSMVAESGINKQTVWLPEAFSNIIGIRFFNTVSSTWDWVNGSAANSLLTFTLTTTTLDINGTMINYDVLTHNGSLIGARQLRFHTV